MTVLLILAAAVVFLGVGGHLYSRFLSRQWGENSSRPTPAVVHNDGRDYVPTPTGVVFAHHFASIAGAGPIVGPVLAMSYGWAPALIWVVLGGLFIGAVHDYLAAFMSTRHGGQSIATIARSVLGRGPFLALVIFLVLSLALVTATFLNLSATALVSTQELGRMKLPEGQTMFRVVEEASQQRVVIGGIASTSVIVITVLAPLMGYLYIKRQVAVWKCALLAVVICTLSIAAGLYFPVAIPSVVDFGSFTMQGKTIWKLILSAYVLIAAGVPVWLFLQSRDFINVHILYAGVVMLFTALVTAGVRGGPPPADVLPAYDAAHGASLLGMFWPAVFITVACGAVSGFHSLCAGGTTCKQLTSERATRHIGYWGMILESTLAVGVIGILFVGVTQSDYLSDVFPRLTMPGKEDNPVLGFAMAVGNSCNRAFGVPIIWGALAGMVLLEGFVITTLDTAVRLARYLIEEVWVELFGKYDVFAGRVRAMHEEHADSPAAGVQGAPIPTSGIFRAFLRFLSLYWINSGFAVGLMLFFSVSSGILALWKLFATSNQLLASFVLAIGAAWLLRQGRRIWYLTVPAAFMVVTTCASLILLARKYAPGQATANPALFIADLVLMGLTAYVIVCCVREILARLRAPRPTPAGV